MKRRSLVLLLLLIVLPVAPGQDEKKKPPSLEDDLKALQGEWVRVKAEQGKYETTLVFGSGEVKNYLQVWRTSIKNPQEVEEASWGRIGMHDKDSKRTVSYNPEKHFAYKLDGGKLVLEGDYFGFGSKINLTGEWKKLEKKKEEKK